MIRGVASIDMLVTGFNPFNDDNDDERTVGSPHVSMRRAYGTMLLVLRMVNGLKPVVIKLASLRLLL